MNKNFQMKNGLKDRKVFYN